MMRASMWELENCTRKNGWTKLGCTPKETKDAAWMCAFFAPRAARRNTEAKRSTPSTVPREGYGRARTACVLLALQPCRQRLGR